MWDGTDRARQWALGALGAWVVLSGACTGRPVAPRGATAATLATGPLPGGPPTPERGLPIPSLDGAWTPLMLVAGDVQALRDVLAPHPSVAVYLGQRFSGESWSSRVRALVQALHPGTDIIRSDRELDPFDGMERSRPRVVEDDRGRPHYRWTAGALPSPRPDASAELVMSDAGLEPDEWGALPSRVQGSCQAPMVALAVGQEQSLAELEPFFDHADRVLWQLYRTALEATLPPLVAELESFGVAPGSTSPSTTRPDQYRCGHAYWEYLQGFMGCVASPTPCPSAPRLFVVGGARIGTIEPTIEIPDACAAQMGRDYVVTLRSVAVDAAEVARDHLAGSWSALTDRLGALTEVYQTLEDVCAPRRRRFASEDLQVARRRLRRVGEALASSEMERSAGQWVRADDIFDVPGIGPVRQVALYEAGPGSPSTFAVAEVRAIRQLLLQQSRCDAHRSPMPLATAVVDGASGEVEFFGYFFEEELFCAELPALGLGLGLSRGDARSPRPSGGARTGDPA